MKKDITTFTRYFIFLIIVFVVWLFLIHKAKSEDTFSTFFGGKDKSSLYIINTKR